jgi:F-type H+-transporting ATPase subunit b
MTTLFILAAEAAAGSSDSPLANMAQQFGVDWPKFISQTIIFVVIAICLKKFAFTPILATLETRRQRIAESLDNADRIKKELADAEASRKEILRKANEQATALITDAQKAAGAQGEKKLQEAVAQAEALIRKAQEQTELDRQKMMLVLKGELANLVIDTTSKVTGKILTAEDQKRLGDETALQLRS